MKGKNVEVNIEKQTKMNFGMNLWYDYNRKLCA